MYFQMNKNENVTVAWLNNSLLETAIKSSKEDENLQVTSYEVITMPVTCTESVCSTLQELNHKLYHSLLRLYLLK